MSGAASEPDLTWNVHLVWLVNFYLWFTSNFYSFFRVRKSCPLSLLMGIIDYYLIISPLGKLISCNMFSAKCRCKQALIFNTCKFIFSLCGMGNMLTKLEYFVAVESCSVNVAFLDIFLFRTVAIPVYAKPQISYHEVTNLFCYDLYTCTLIFTPGVIKLVHLLCLDPPSTRCLWPCQICKTLCLCWQTDNNPFQYPSLLRRADTATLDASYSFFFLLV